MDARSETCLAHVHPDLVKIVRRASEITKQPFIVICGLRTVDQQKVNVKKGVSQTMHSRHLPGKEGYACAIDVAAITDKKVDWVASHYQPIAAAMLQAAHELNLCVEWGGDWKTLKDWGHFQLPWAVYK